MMNSSYAGLGEKFVCDACGHEHGSLKLYDHHMVAVDDSNLQEKVQEFHNFPGYLFKGGVAICQQCGYGKMLSPPSEEALEEFYKALFWKQREGRVDNAQEGVVSKNHQLRSECQIAMALQFKSIDTIKATLEIGAGEAFASRCLKDKSSNVEAFVCEAGEQWDSHYKALELKRIADYFPYKGDDKFDLVVASHWLEHVLDLPLVLCSIREKLNGDGLLVIDVPNTQHDYWDVPERDIPHIHFFTPLSLTRLCESHGFQCLSVESYGISILQRQAGVEIQPQDFAANDKGYGIRAVFAVDN